jgi:hypothetical protein
MTKYRGLDALFDLFDTCHAVIARLDRAIQ